MTSRDQIAARRVEGVERIAVVRANGLGDLMFVLPALDALRATYPAAEIVLLGGPLPEELLATRPSAVDRVLRPPVWRGVWSPAGQEPDDGATDAFFARMQAEGFDLALQLHGGGANSNPFTARLGARLTAGLRAPDAATG